MVEVEQLTPSRSPDLNPTEDLWDELEPATSAPDLTNQLIK